MSVRSRIRAATAWILVVVLPLGACAAPGKSGRPSASGASPTRASPTASPTVSSEAPSQAGPVVNFDGIPAPQACDPNAPKFVDLGAPELSRNPYVPDGGGQAVSVDLGNKVKLTINVYARDPEQPKAEGPISTYFKELKACFEILPGGPHGRFDEFSVEAPETTLLNVIEQEIQLGPAALRARREQLIIDDNITVSDSVGMSLEEVVARLGGDGNSVLTEARTKALSNIDAALASGSIAPEQADALKADVNDGQLDQHFRDPHAAILIESPEDPGEMLRADPQNLVIQLDLSEKPAENSVVFFDLDPRIYQDKWAYYSWVKGTSASTTVKAAEGEVCASLWKYISTLELRGVRCPTAVSTSTEMSGSSTDPRYFTAKVYGVKWNEGRGNYYELYGTWRVT